MQRIGKLFSQAKLVGFALFVISKIVGIVYNFLYVSETYTDLIKGMKE